MRILSVEGARSLSFFFALPVLLLGAIWIEPGPIGQIMLWLLTAALLFGCFTSLNNILKGHGKNWVSVIPSAFSLGFGVFILILGLILSSSETSRGFLYFAISVFLLCAAYAASYNAKTLGISDGLVMTIVQVGFALLISVVVIIKMFYVEGRQDRR